MTAVRPVSETFLDKGPCAVIWRNWTLRWIHLSIPGADDEFVANQGPQVVIWVKPRGRAASGRAARVCPPRGVGPAGGAMGHWGGAALADAALAAGRRVTGTRGRQAASAARAAVA